jgi:hypothetical protein
MFKQILVSLALLSGSPLVVMSAVAQTAPPLILQASADGRVLARTPDGAIAWRVDRERSGPLTYRIDERGRFLIDDCLLVDRWGRVVARMRARGSAAALGVSSPEAPGWSAPVEISGGDPFIYSAFTPAVVDSSGAAWVVLNGSTGAFEENLQVTHTSGPGAPWTPPETLYDVSPTSGIFPPAVVIDANDRITVAYREGANGMDEVRVLRYVPGVGWSGPTTIFSTDNANHGFQNVYSVLDAQGNVIVCFDGDLGTAMYAIAYDAASDMWGPATLLSPPSPAIAKLPTLIQNRSGDYVYALYQAFDSGGNGLYLRRFRSATLDWASPQHVPGTGRAEIPGGIETGSRIPATVDDEGNVTLPFYLSIVIQRKVVRLLRAARLENGAWSGPVTILRHLGSLPLITDASDIDYSAAGDVMFVFKAVTQIGVQLRALHYDGSRHAWDEAASIYHDSSTTTTPSQVVYRVDGTAVATYYDYNAAGISARVFENSAWMPRRYTVPDSTTELVHASTAAGQNVVALFGEPIERASWLTGVP